MPFTRPDPATELPKFADVDATDPVSGQVNVAIPSPTLQNSGWTRAQYASRQHFNWLHRWTYRWLGWLDTITQAHENNLNTPSTGLNALVGTLDGRIDDLETTIDTPTTGLVDRVGVIEGYNYPKIVSTQTVEFRFTGSIGNHLQMIFTLYNNDNVEIKWNICQFTPATGGISSISGTIPAVYLDGSFRVVPVTVRNTLGAGYTSIGNMVLNAGAGITVSRFDLSTVDQVWTGVAHYRKSFVV